MTDPPDPVSALNSDDARAAFRARARSWLETNAVPRGAPDDFSASHLFTARSLEDYWVRERAVFAQAVRWQRKLYQAGWAGLSWPEMYGGRGLPEWTEEEFAGEQARFGVSTKVLSVGLQMAASVLRRHGTETQQTLHLPLIVRAEEIWCQLFSEPDAGSDLASISSRAIPTTDGWEVTGQKVWTSGAGVSDLGLLLARTDPSSKGRFGLSCFIVPMGATGVEVRPLREMSGSYHFNEVFLEDVHLGPAALVGEEGDGWTVARTMLSSERSAIGGGTSARSVHDLIRTATSMAGPHERPQPLKRQAVAAAYIRERILDFHMQRVQDGSAGMGAASVGKLMYSEHARLSASSALTLIGMAAVAGHDNQTEAWQDRFLFSPGLRIGGGTDEIQRNVIAERGLGLPREHKAPETAE
jgi:alkylation response protein AidB-like acyl-CoA dehydrogenase